MADLPRLQESVEIVDEEGRPSFPFHVWWDKFAQAIESQITDLSDAIADIAAAQAAAAAAQATANSKAKVTRASSAPSSPNTNDVWVDTSVSPVVVKVWTGTVWSQSARNTTNTTEVTDGAGLGTTAIWNNVSGTGKPADNATVGGNLATNVTGTLDDVANGSTYAKIKGSELSSGVHKLTVGSSGMTIGDQRNLPPISAANLRYRFTGTSSYTSTTTTATISVTAGSLILGSTSISYNAMSANVSGSPSTTVVYYLYVSANAYSNGAHTLHTTTTGTDIYNDDNYVYIDTISVTYPAAGTGGGSGDGSGGGACVEDTSLILMADGSEKQAADLKVGDKVLTYHEDTYEFNAYTVTAVQIAADWVYYRQGWPNATAKHRFSSPLMKKLPKALRWFSASLFGRQLKIARVMKITVDEAHTYLARHPFGTKFRLCHNVKPS